MAVDNFSRFNTFTNVNPNIAELGYTAEEHKITQGAPDANPIHSPMAAPGVSETQLALRPAGSDRLRLDSPEQPAINPYEGPKRTLSLSRNAVAKLRGRVLSDLQGLVDQGAIGSPEVRERMSDSMRRVGGMCDYMAHLNTLADSIVYNTLANAAG